jgi:hypothetical protein
MKFFGSVKDGKLILSQKEALNQWVNSLDEKSVSIEIKEVGTRRSVQQNAYWWGVAIPYLQRGLTDLGWDLTAEEVHYFIKDKFLKKQIVNNQTGEMTSMVGDTRTLSKKDFGEFLERVQRFAATTLSVIIPDPNETK